VSNFLALAGGTHAQVPDPRSQQAGPSNLCEFINDCLPRLLRYSPRFFKLANDPANFEANIPLDEDLGEHRCIIWLPISPVLSSDTSTLFEDPLPDNEMRSTPSPNPFRNDDTKIVYHPHCGKPDEFFHLEEYNSSLPRRTNIPTEANPWRPFRTRTDFEIAELILDTHMNKDQTRNFLKLLHQIAANPKCFTITNKNDLDNTWKGARSFHASGVSTRIPFPAYKLL